MVKRSEERAEFLEAIMSTALEGGVGYWSSASEIVRSNGEYVSYRLFCSDGGRDAVECVVTRELCLGHVVEDEVIARGLRRIHGTPGDELNDSLRRHICECDRENDGGEIDAGDADVVVQMGIFGDVVYG